MAGENPQTTLPPVPREPMIDQRGQMSQQWTRWIQQVQRVLSFTGGVAWGIINKAGSKLSDLAERTHAMLTDILGWTTGADTTQNKHISNADGKVWQDHVEIVNDNPHGTDHDMLDGLADDDHAQYLLLAGRPGQTAATPLILGGVTDNTTFESDGTAKFNGAATVWKDIFFPMAPPKTAGAGNPSLVTWNGNLRGYSFAVGDAHDFDPQEFVHDGKEGSTATWHIHIVSRTNVAATRAVKYQLEYSQANRNGVFPAPTVVSMEITIPANTTALTHIAEDIGTFTTGLVAGQMFVRLTRIASAGTAPADDPVIIGVHYHYEIDTVGSRAIFTK